MRQTRGARANPRALIKMRPYRGAPKAGGIAPSGPGAGVGAGPGWRGETD